MNEIFNSDDTDEFYKQNSSEETSYGFTMNGGEFEFFLGISLGSHRHSYNVYISRSNKFQDVKFVTRGAKNGYDMKFLLKTEMETFSKDHEFKASEVLRELNDFFILTPSVYFVNKS